MQTNQNTELPRASLALVSNTKTSMDSEGGVRLKADDGTLFSIALAVAQAIPPIKAAMKTADLSKKDIPPYELPPNIQSFVFRKVLDWVEKHKDDAPPAKTTIPGVKSVEIHEKWDKDFVKMDQMTLFQTVLAANILELHPLVDLCSKAIASLIRGKDQQQLQKTFNLRHDWRPEEKQIFIEANQWIFGGEYISPNEKLQKGLSATRKESGSSVQEKKGDGKKA